MDKNSTKIDPSHANDNCLLDAKSLDNNQDGASAQALNKDNVVGNMSDGDARCDALASIDSATVDTGLVDNQPKEPSNLDDYLADKNITTYEERVKQAMENNPLPPCSRDSKADEKFSKYSTYACIPFFIAGIIVTLLDKAKYRSPWSFLLIGLAACTLAIGAILRYKNNLKCKCSVCETQGKTLRSSAILWSILTVGCMIAFVVFLIINLRA